MKKYRKIKRIIATITFVIAIVITAISPGNMLLAYSGTSDVIDADFSEVLTDDKRSTEILLEITEKENQEIQSIILPDGRKVAKEEFERAEKVIKIKYVTERNGEHAYTVAYVEKTDVIEETPDTVEIMETPEAIAETPEATESTEVAEVTENLQQTTSETKEEKLTYEVIDVKTLEDMKLEVTAKDISFSVDEDVNVTKDIVIKNEDNEDITSSLNINVVDYNGIIEKVAGAYIVKYSVLYPENSKTYEFSRTITLLSSTQNNLQANRSTLAENKEIANITLSPGNASLKNPEDFVIAKKDQEQFNFTLTFAPSIADKNRTLKFYIPRGFSLVKELTLGDLSLASSINYEKRADGVTVGTVIFKDNIQLVTGFDINVTQDKKMLYDDAHISANDYGFKVEGLVGTTSISEKVVTFHTDKLSNTITENGITMDPMKDSDMNHRFDSSNGMVSAWNTDTLGTISIKKNAFTDLATTELILPRQLNADKTKYYFNYSKYQVLSGGVVIKEGVLPKLASNETSSSYIKVNLMEQIPEFLYSYEDTELRFMDVHFRFQHGSYHVGQGFLYDSPEKPWKTEDAIQFTGYKSFGEIALNPQLKVPHLSSKPYGNQPTTFVDSLGNLVQGKPGATRYLQHGFRLPFDSNGNWYKEVSIEYEFPYEVQPFEMYLDGTIKNIMHYKKGILEFVTNQRTFVLSKIDMDKLPSNIGFNFESLLQPGEVVKNIKLTTAIIDNFTIDFAYRIAKKAENGDEFTSTKTVQVVETITIPQEAHEEKKSYDVIIRQAEETLKPTVYDRRKVKLYIGDSGVIANGNIEGNFYQSSFDDRELEIQIKGEELLSISDSVTFIAYPKIAATYYVVYSTNKGRKIKTDKFVSSSISSSTHTNVDFNLTEDEYVTELSIFVEKLNSDLVSFDENSFYKSTSFFQYTLNSEKLPSHLPYKDESIIDKSFALSTTLRSSLAIPGYPKTANGFSNTFAEKPEILMGINSPTTAQANGNGVLSNNLFEVAFKVSDSLNVQNMEIDFSETDKDILSMIGRIRRGNSYSGTEIQVEYKTNKKEGWRTISNTTNIDTRSYYDFKLEHDEYITKLVLKASGYKVYTTTYYENYLIFEKRRDYPRTLPISGDMISDGGIVSRDVKATFSYDGIDKKQIKGRSKTTSKQVYYPNISKTVTDVTQDSSAHYQGSRLEVSLNDLGIDMDADSEKKYEFNRVGDDYNYLRIVNPTVYLVVDKGISINSNEISIDGYDVDVKFENNKLSTGESILSIKFNDYEKIFRSGDITTPYLSILQNLKVQGLVKPSAEAKTSKIITKAYLDINDSFQEYASYISDFKPSSSNLGLGLEAEISDKNLYQLKINSPDHQVLPLTEMGVGITGQRADAELGESIVGYDNEVYKEQLSIVSNISQATYDWVMYVPVPKIGDRVKYSSGSEIVESEASEYSLYLEKEISTLNMPTDTKIEYTTDKTPLYALDGTSIGNYTENPSDLKDVTMIKITIPKLEAKQKLFPEISFKVDGNKNALGLQNAFAGNYYNVKIGSEGAPYVYGDTGAYSNPVTFTLKDFTVSGTVWNDLDVPMNEILDDTDALMKDVEVSISDEYKTVTDIDGKYVIEYPTHGDVTLTVKKPDKLDTIPAETYSFVATGSNQDSSWVDTAGEYSFTFMDKDVKQVNAGLWAERSVTVHPESITVKKGETVNVPAVTFPGGIEITYDVASNPAIATVSTDGKATGVKVGTTKATVLIPDGKGGTFIAEYEINVIPTHAPTVTSDPIYIFEEYEYDPREGVTIVDGDDSPVDVNDTSKVSIDTSAVNTKIPGRYPIVYTVNDGYETVNVTRFVYVYGNVKLIKPDDKTIKINTDYVATEGATASYLHINEDGTSVRKGVEVTSPTSDSTTPSTAQNVTVSLIAGIEVNGVFNAAVGDYNIKVNEHPVINTDQGKIKVEVGTTLDKIKDLINATASMKTPDGSQHLQVDWSALDTLDTSQIIRELIVKITTIDPDTGVTVTKEITIIIAEKCKIEAPKFVDLVLGEVFDPTKDVKLTDGYGTYDHMLVVDEMVTHNVPIDSDGKVTKPGNYEVKYHNILDGFGSWIEHTTRVRVHGPIEHAFVRIDQIVGDDVSEINSKDISKDLAWYINSDGDKKEVTYVTSDKMTSDTVNKSEQSITFKHPINSTEELISRDIYTHGQLELIAPSDLTVKVNDEVSILNGASAKYERVLDDGRKEEINVEVSSILGDTTTSTIPGKKEIPITATVQIVNGRDSTLQKSYHVFFNGYPEIKVAKEEITVRVGATEQEIKVFINAQASVYYGKDEEATDLTDQITWENFDKVDTSVENGTFEVTLKVIDADGEEVTKTVTIKVSADIIINLPEVDKVVGDTFDPFEDVHILDGNGNAVDPKGVIVDDSKVDLSKPGSYDVTYTYEDELGNEKTETNTVRVNGNLQFDKLDRVDLIEKENTTYISNGGKAYYIDYKNERVDVEGAFDKNVNQGIVGKSEVTFSATHPVDKKADGVTQEVYVHGDIVFHYPPSDFTGKVNTTISISDKVTASYKHVNDDGTVEKINVPVTGADVTSDKVGNVDATVDAKVEIVHGLVIEKTDNVQVSFNGLPFIEAAGSLYFDGSPTIEDIKNAIDASAGMKKTDGFVIDLTPVIDYSNLDKVALDKSGTYEVRITVKDPDGFITYKDITVTITIPEPEKPVIPPVEPPVEPEKPVIPPVEPEKPDDNGGNSGSSGDNGGNGGNNGDNGGNSGSNGDNSGNSGSSGDNGGNSGSNGDNGGNSGSNGNNGNNSENNGDNTGTAGSGETVEDSKKNEVTTTVITKDIPLSKAKENVITDDFIKSYITATSKLLVNKNFVIESHNIGSKVGTYEVTIRFDDGSKQTISINVVDDTQRDVQQPEYGREDDCIIHWIILLLLLGYSVYSITMIMKRRHENEELEKSLNEYSTYKMEGGE